MNSDRVQWAQAARAQRLQQRAVKDLRQQAATLPAPAPPTPAPRPVAQRPVIRPDIHARFQRIVKRALEAPE